MSTTSGTYGTGQSVTGTQTQTLSVGAPTTRRYPTTIYLILQGVRTEWHESDAGQTLTIPEFTLRLDYDRSGTTGGVGGDDGCGSASGAASAWVAAMAMAMAMASGSGSASGYGSGYGHGSGSVLNPDLAGVVSRPSVLEVAQMMGRQLLMVARETKWTDTELIELSEVAAAAAANMSAEICRTNNCNGNAYGGGPSTVSTTAGSRAGAGFAERGGLMYGGRTLSGLASALRGQPLQALIDQSWELTCRVMEARGEHGSADGIGVALTTWREYEEQCWSRGPGAGGV